MIIYVCRSWRITLFEVLFNFEIEDKIHEFRQVCERGGSLEMPLGVRDEIVTALTARISPAELEVLHLQLPKSQVVGQQVDLRQQGGPGRVHLRAQVQT